MKKYFAAIMAGGVGSRFWPASREHNPKQFHDIAGNGTSLIRSTFDRFLKILPVEQIYIVTHVQYRDLVKQHLPEIPFENIVCEPTRNNTAPSVAYISYKIKQKIEDAIIIVAPSDHLIEKEDIFLQHVMQGFRFCEQEDALVTLGIQPTRPDTGYGYIHFGKEKNKGLSKVIEFREKPDYDTAKLYFTSGDYLWNAGIFIWSVDSITRSFAKYCPSLAQVFETNIQSLNSPDEDAFIEKEYPLTQNISIDYAILEKADNVFTIPVDIGWSDLGTWKSVYELSDKDINQNVIQANGEMSEVNNCLIKCFDKNKKVVIGGLENYMIIDTEDALLIYPIDKEQEVKKVTELLKKTNQVKFL